MSHFTNETTAEEVCEALSSRINGKTILITGTSHRGLGAKAAITLAKQSPAQLILVSRSQAKVDPVIEEIKAINPQVVAKFVACELADQDSVRKAAETILNDAGIEKIDIVINNAGVMAIPDYQVDNKGNELQFSSNHIGHFLLTNLILPKVLAAGPGARIVNHTSHGHRIGPFRFDDPKFSGGKEYDGWSGYGQSKTANILFSVELARRLKGRGIQAYAVHPGVIYTTGLADHLDWTAVGSSLADVTLRNTGVEWWMESQVKSDSQGAASALVAALDPAVTEATGSYIENCAVGEPMPYAVDPDNAKKLWAYSEELVGQKFDF